MSGFVDYLRMAMGWWSAPAVSDRPIGNDCLIGQSDDSSLVGQRSLQTSLTGQRLSSSLIGGPEVCD